MNPELEKKHFEDDEEYEAFILTDSSDNEKKLINVFLDEKDLCKYNFVTYSYTNKRNIPVIERKENPFKEFYDRART